MSGIEIAIPVISALFALVSAFKDGGTIIEKIKDRRGNKGAQLPDEDLQKALYRGHDELLRLRANGVEEFGDGFDKDETLASSLKDVTIALQYSVIKQLTAAWMDDSMNEFGPLINSARQARMDAVEILNNHCRALQGRYERDHNAQAYDVDVQSRAPTRQSTGLTMPPSRRETQSMGNARFEAPGAPERRRSGLSWRPSFHRTSADESRRRQQQQQSTPPHSNAASPEPGAQRTEHGAGTIQPLSPESMIDSSGMPSPGVHRSPTTASVLSASSTGREVVLISESTNFGGLCKSAIRAQQMKLKKAMKATMKEYEWLYQCEKCKYRLRADPRHRGNPHFDDNPKHYGSIRFRYMFIWKSHIATQDRVHRYKCLLCLLGGIESSVYQGEDRLMQHIVRHENQYLGSTRLLGAFEITPEGITPATEETFDLSFQPRQQISSPGFMLPESALGITAVQCPQQSPQDDLYGNAWQS